MRTRELERLRRSPDLSERVEKWRAGHLTATLRDAVADLDLWPRPDDRDAQWLVWTVLRDTGDPVAARGFPAMRAAAQAAAP